ncbi:hypothetical protein F4821DRAFT_61855 [Hypoxylon rubiginosum]|uniref:Uncharacterized protein n=1 Tax=Hypoxylon rubiginosum TaxID=110542 RepID=A0ACC0DA09_9PEZI|nr:hypothetical protein F4821DRAFT_61855 [Hypoxylon rubiginosum]
MLPVKPPQKNQCTAGGTVRSAPATGWIRKQKEKPITRNHFRPCKAWGCMPYKGAPGEGHFNKGTNSTIPMGNPHRLQFLSLFMVAVIEPVVACRGILISFPRPFLPICPFRSLVGFYLPVYVFVFSFSAYDFRGGE